MIDSSATGPGAAAPSGDPRGALLRRYVALMDRDIAPAFAEAQARAEGAIPCGRGCAKCCAGLFAINALDAALLREGIAEAEPEARDAILGGARALIERVRQAQPEWERPWRIERIGWREFGRLAAALDSRCPALGPDEACLLYEHRPRVGRLQGISWFDPETGDALKDFCESIFGSAAYSAVPPQPMRLTLNSAETAELLEEWRALTGETGHTFVAAALLSQGSGGFAVSRED
jgi:Fe-S-cluster containining protein